MLQLRLNTSDNISLQQRVNALLIPSEVIQDKLAEAPLLIDGDNKITGKVEINEYLDKLDGFVKQWYACRCDMFP